MKNEKLLGTLDQRMKIHYENYMQIINNLRFTYLCLKVPKRIFKKKFLPSFRIINLFQKHINILQNYKK